MGMKERECKPYNEGREHGEDEKRDKRRGERKKRGVRGKKGEGKEGIDRALGFDEDNGINTGCRKSEGWKKVGYAKSGGISSRTMRMEIPPDGVRSSIVGGVKSDKEGKTLARRSQARMEVCDEGGVDKKRDTADAVKRIKTEVLPRQGWRYRRHDRGDRDRSIAGALQPDEESKRESEREREREGRRLKGEEEGSGRGWGGLRLANPRHHSPLGLAGSLL
ncbi:hypothetical protein DBV15_10172 [Temnothorax longispinosus]|uniref:Uncharacterized protein n=1 Tax=Temnothorax longispinosus TaxID=300112 RepID=A0A4S2JSK7_9HYME|nr:hypothetical protein DBV15_10172 [Temnothorax longispinosus]